MATFQKAHYIKLGRGGCWEEDCIANSRLRFGYKGQHVDDINKRAWDRIKKQLLRKHGLKKSNVATTDLNQLKAIVEAGDETVFITFYQNKLWWTVAQGEVEKDHISKFRRTKKWSDTARKSGRKLFINELPGKIAEIQAFRGTLCSISDSGEKFETLLRILEGKASNVARNVERIRCRLTEAIAEAIKTFHWKDFEILVDLVFARLGWRRVGELGGVSRAFDMVYEAPIVEDKYLVQVKSRVLKERVASSIMQYDSEAYRRLFIVTHSNPDDKTGDLDVHSNVTVINADLLAHLVMEAGLVDWIAKKAR